MGTVVLVLVLEAGETRGYQLRAMTLVGVLSGENVPASYVGMEVELIGSKATATAAMTIILEAAITLALVVLIWLRVPRYLF